jgi:hypothetical protein
MESRSSRPQASSLRSCEKPPRAVHSYERFALALIPGPRYWALSVFVSAVPKLDERSWLKRSLKAWVSSHDLAKEPGAHRSPDRTRRR